MDIGLNDCIVIVALVALALARRAWGFTTWILLAGQALILLACVGAVFELMDPHIALPLSATTSILVSRKYSTMAGLLAGVTVCTISLDLMAPSSSPVLVLVTIAGLLFARTTSEQKQRLRTELVFAQARAAEQEREHVMQDLHDGLGHDLTVLRLSQSAMSRALERGDEDRVSQAMDECTRLVTDAQHRLRQIVEGQATVSLHKGLADAIQELQAAGIVATVVPSGIPDLPPPIEQAMAWILMEAVTNVLRHANATAVEFDIAVNHDEARLRITDNGHGLRRVRTSGALRSSGDIGTSDERHKGRGLSGMRTRAAALSGTVDFRSTSTGSTVSVTIPVHQALIARVQG